MDKEHILSSVLRLNNDSLLTQTPTDLKWTPKTEFSPIMNVINVYNIKLQTEMLGKEQAQAFYTYMG